MVGTISGRDDPAAVVRDSQLMGKLIRRGRFSLRREKVVRAEGGASALPLTNGELNMKRKI